MGWSLSGHTEWLVIEVNHSNTQSCGKQAWSWVYPRSQYAHSFRIIQMCMCARMHTHTHRYMHTHTHRHRQTQTHTHTHRHTHTDVDTHTHMHRCVAPSSSAPGRQTWMSSAAGFLLFSKCFWRCCSCTLSASPDPRMPWRERSVPEVSSPKPLLEPHPNSRPQWWHRVKGRRKDPFFVFQAVRPG